MFEVISIKFCINIYIKVVYLAFFWIFRLLQMSVSMVLKKYQNVIEMTSNMIYIVAFVGGLKCPHKIHLNAQCPTPPTPPHIENLTRL